MEQLTEKQALELERLKNVHIDRQNNCFNRPYLDRNAMYGWEPIPETWRREVNNIK